MRMHQNISLKWTILVLLSLAWKKNVSSQCVSAKPHQFNLMQVKRDISRFTELFFTRQRRQTCTDSKHVGEMLWQSTHFSNLKMKKIIITGNHYVAVKRSIAPCPDIHKCCICQCHTPVYYRFLKKLPIQHRWYMSFLCSVSNRIRNPMIIEK